MEDTFFLDTNEGSIECRVITNLYSEKRKKHYLVYEYVDEKNDDLYVSSYDPEDESSVNELNNKMVINFKSLKKVKSPARGKTAATNDVKISKVEPDKKDKESK